MVSKEQPTDLKGQTRAQLIMARRADFHKKAEYICADLSSRPNFPLQSCGGPYILGTNASVPAETAFCTAIQSKEAENETTQEHLTIHGYEEQTAGDDGVRGQSTRPLAAMHPIRSSHRARRDYALQVLSRPGASVERIFHRRPSPHRAPAKPSWLQVSGRRI